MTTPALLGRSTPSERPLGRRSLWLLAAAHVPLLLVPVLITVFLADTMDRPDPTITAAAAVAVCVLQIRHGLAAAHGVRPPGWPLTLLALAALVYLPLIWLPNAWITTQWALVASMVMLLPRRAGPVLAALVVVGSEAVLTLQVVQQYGLGPVVSAWAAAYNLTVAALGPIALLAATRLIRVLDDLSAAHAELAEAAVAQDRLRISRDLHDVLGQSLTAVSLKGELAMRLWATDRPAALAEIESLTTVARAALRDVSAVAFDRHPTSVRSELDGAAALLRAAGIETRIEVALSDTPRVQDDALGWVLREGVTNVLRHSTATRVTIRGGQHGRRLHLEIVNDGATRDGGAPGSGLAGLTARLAPLGGVLTAGELPGARFRLTVDLPEELP
jgi:two-component system, NarL family, sensor histidine kinase DesK